jgi:hypothetical protein
MRTTKQQFWRGDRVTVKGNHGSEYKNPNEAIVLGSYRDVCHAHHYGEPRNLSQYCLLFEYKDGQWSSVSWFDASRLTLVENIGEEALQGLLDQTDEIMRSR